jgi:hypothetical protein
MPIIETVRVELTAAMKAGDAHRRDIMRLLLAALGNARIEAQHDLSDDEAMRVLQREAKQRRESIEAYREGGRDDLVQVEQRELELIESFLPAALSEQEAIEMARSAIAEVGAGGPGDVGKVMGPLMKRIDGRFDGRRANELVQELLASG